MEIEPSDRTGLFFILYYPCRRTKTIENTSTLYHPGCGSQVQTGAENWHRKPMRGFNFVPIRSDPMLIFPREDRPKGRFPLRKISIGSDWTLFHLVLSTAPDQKS